MELGFLVCEWIPHPADGIVISGFFNNTNERILHTLIRFVTSSAKLALSWCPKQYLNVRIF